MLAAEIEDSWVAVLDRAGKELCEAIECHDYRIVATLDELPSGRLGASIPIVGEVKVQLILLTTNSGARTLAQGLLHYTEDDPPLSRDDVQDAFCELANQFAGLVKRHIGAGNSVKLGLPVFLRGVVRPSPGASLYAQEVRWGSTPVVLGLLTGGS